MPLAEALPFVLLHACRLSRLTAIHMVSLDDIGAALASDVRLRRRSGARSGREGAEIGVVVIRARAIREIQIAGIRIALTVGDALAVTPQP